VPARLRAYQGSEPLGSRHTRHSCMRKMFRHAGLAFPACTPSLGQWAAH